MAFEYNYGGYPVGNYYAPPMPDQLAQLRGAAYQPMMGQQMAPNMQPQAQNRAPQSPAQPVQQTQQAQQNGGGTIWINGEAGAKGYLVAPGSTVMLMDADAPVFYLKSADAAGVPSLRIFDYKERTAAVRMPPETPKEPTVEYVPRETFDALVAKTDALAAELEALKASKTKKPAVKEDAENGK